MNNPTEQVSTDRIADELDVNRRSSTTSTEFGDFNRNRDFIVCGVYQHPDGHWQVKSLNGVITSKGHIDRGSALAKLLEEVLPPL